MRKAYQTDLSDAQWRSLQSYLPAPTRAGASGRSRPSRAMGEVSHGPATHSDAMKMNCRKAILTPDSVYSQKLQAALISLEPRSLREERRGAP
jgi:hypothetical protein